MLPRLFQNIKDWCKTNISNQFTSHINMVMDKMSDFMNLCFVSLCTHNLDERNIASSGSSKLFTSETFPFQLKNTATPAKPQLMACAMVTVYKEWACSQMDA